jgi:hypothetical protein
MADGCCRDKTDAKNQIKQILTELNMNAIKSFSMIVLLSLALSSVAFAQDTGGGGQGGGGQGGGGQVGGGTGNPVTTPTNGQNFGGSGGSTGAGGGSTGAIDPTQSLSLSQDVEVPEIIVPTNVRNEVPFVGPSSANPVFNPFEGVGALGGAGGGAGGLGSQIGGSAFGGQLGGGQFGANQFGGQFGGQLGGFGQQNGLIQRKNVRAVLRPAFASPVVTGTQISNRFENRLYRIPSIQRLGGSENVRVTVTDGTAVISGNVQSSDARTKIERMAKLEPGIYRVVNQLEIGQ